MNDTAFFFLDFALALFLTVKIMPQMHSLLWKTHTYELKMTAGITDCAHHCLVLGIDFCTVSYYMKTIPFAIESEYGDSI